MRKIILILSLITIALFISACSQQNKVETPKEDEPDLLNVQKEKVVDQFCKANEEVVFSFKTENNGKVLSICVSKEPSYIVYRFGTKDKIELEFPGDKKESWNRLSYSYYLRGGGKNNEGLDLNYLSFDNEGYKYVVYEEYSARDDSTSVGIKVTDKKTNKEFEIKGENITRIGTLVSLRDSKIKQKPMYE